MTASAKFGSVCATKLALALIAYLLIPWKAFYYLHLFRQFLTKRLVEKM